MRKHSLATELLEGAHCADRSKPGDSDTRARFTCTCTRHPRHTPLAQVFQLHAGVVWRPIRESVRVKNCKRETTSIAMCVAMMRFNQNRSPYMGQINGNCILHSHCFFLRPPAPPTQS
jgi:hypothetical protein